MRSPLTETIKRVEGMIAYVRENLDEGEYDLFLDLVLPEPVKAAKKGRKKSSKGGSKSARAQSLSGAIQRTPKSKADDDNDDDNDDDGDGKGMGGPLCQTCGNFRQYQDHFKPSPNYHEFDAGKSSAFAAPRAGGKSSTNGGAGSTTASSEAERENVSTATGG